MRGSMMYLAILAALCASLAAAAVAKDELYCPPINGVEDVLHPKAENCSEFYKCNYGELVTISCPAGLLYCAAYKWCDYPDNCDYSNCKISPVKEDNKEEPDNNGEQNKGDQQIEGGDQNNYGDLYCPPELEGSDILYSQPDNCNEFYQCYYGKLFKLRCQQGLYYCPTNKWCDYAENCDYAKYCKMPSSVNVPQEGNKNDQEEDVAPDTGVEQSKDGDLYCPPELEGSDILYSQPDNCNEFYQCYYGKIFKLQCQQGLYYCPTTKWCDYAENCDYAKYCKMPSSVNVPQEGNKNDQEEDVAPDTRLEQSKDGELTCNLEGALYPNPDNCKEFYQCARGRAYVKQCPAGLFYCASANVCDYPDTCDYSNCRLSVVKLPPITLNEDEPIHNTEQNNGEQLVNDVEIITYGELYCPATNGVEDVLHPKAENCSEFYKCNYGELVTISCPAGLLYCAANKWCDYPDNCDYSNCKISPVKEDNKEEPSNNGEQNNGNQQIESGDQNNHGELYCPPELEGSDILYSEPDNCNEFYQCYYGKIFKLRCQQGLYYCPTNKWCDYAENCDYAKYCKMPSSVNVPQEGNKNDQEEDVVPDTGVEQSKDGELTCNVEGALYPNPANCNEFYQCARGRAFVKQCPAGLYFCASESVCDYPYNCNYNCKAP